MNQGSLLNSFGLFSPAVATHLNSGVCEQSAALIAQRPDLQLTQEFIEAAVTQIQEMEQLDCGTSPARIAYLEALKPLLSRSAAELEELLFPASRVIPNIWTSSINLAAFGI